MLEVITFIIVAVVVALITKSSIIRKSRDDEKIIDGHEIMSTWELERLPAPNFEFNGTMLYYSQEQHDKFMNNPDYQKRLHREFSDFAIRNDVVSISIYTQPRHGEFIFTQCVKFALRGHPHALFALLYCYNRGVGVIQDMKIADAYRNFSKKIGVHCPFYLNHSISTIKAEAEQRMKETRKQSEQNGGAENQVLIEIRKIFD